MARLHPVDPELVRRAGLRKPTPPEDLQIQNLPREERSDEGAASYPRWDLLLDYWDEVPE